MVPRNGEMWTCIGIESDGSNREREKGRESERDRVREKWRDSSNINKPLCGHV